MTGSLQVKKDYYYTVIYVPDGMGKTKPQWRATGLSVKGNKRRAEQVLRERIVALENEEDSTQANDIFFDQFMCEWLDVIKTQVETNTYNSYRLVVENQIIPYFNRLKVRLSDLQPLHIQQYYNFCLKKGVSGNTIKHYHANIHKALNYAAKARLISYNPASLVELPKKTKFIGQTYNESQVRQLLTLVKGTEIEAAVMFAVSYGLRRSEIIGLKWDAVDFEKKTITIRHTVTGSGKNLIAANKTKNKSSYRTLPLIGGLDSYLRRLKKYQQEMKSLLGNQYTDNNYICRWDDGRLVLPDHLSRKFNEIIAQNKLPKWIGYTKLDRKNRVMIR